MTVNSKNSGTTLPPAHDGELANYKNQVYSIKYVNTTYGYYLVPTKTPNTEFGFWVKFTDCQYLAN